MRDTDLLHHEDIEIGRPVALGRKTVTKEEIIAFARQFDPQPMHLDEEAAKATLTRGLCASGFHTCAMMMRLVVDGLLGRVASLGSPGVDEVRWIKPVRPGDILEARYTCTEKRVLASRPDVGLAKILVEMVKDTGEPVATWRSNQLTRMRHPATAQPAPAKAARKPMPTLWDDGTVATAPVADIFFEDRRIGEVVDIGEHSFGKAEIVDFARQFDPQPFHLDEEAAKTSLFGALCASGWHTASSFIRCVVTSRMALNATARARGDRIAVYGPSPGFRNLLWFHPVFVGDTVSFRARLTEKVDLKSRPERGLLVNEVQGRNQNGTVVFAITSQILAERREPYRA
ncbi:MAG: MaoC family dehydratase [Pseudorhodoplanes sp.]